MFVKVNFIENKIKLYASLSDLMVKMKSLKQYAKFEKMESNVILFPTAVNLTGIVTEHKVQGNGNGNGGKQVEREQAFILDMQDIKLNMSSLMLKTSMSLVNSISSSLEKYQKQTASSKAADQSPDTTVATRGESSVKLESLFRTIAFENNEFWFTESHHANNAQPLQSTISSASSSSTISSSDSGNDLQQQRKCQVSLCVYLFLILLNITKNNNNKNSS